MHLNWVGSYVDEGRRHSYCSAFKVLAIVFAFYIGIDQLLSALLSPYDQMLSYDYNTETGEFIAPNYSLVPTWVWAVIGLRYVLEILFVLYMFVLLVRTRAFVRRRYKISEGECFGCEDCCCAFWLPCCTTLQIARHTADYEKFPAACCTETGLPSTVPHIV
jgi:PLAC8 family